jgi:hypothetical protein
METPSGNLWGLVFAAELRPWSASSAISLRGEVGAALAVVAISSERAAKEERLRNDMIRVAHRAGASVRQLSEVSGLGRKTVSAIVSAA